MAFPDECLKNNAVTGSPQAMVAVNMLSPNSGSHVMQSSMEDWVIAAIPQGWRDTLRCPNGGSFSKVDFASWGLYHSTGSGQFVQPANSDCKKDAKDFVQQACIGRQECTLHPDVSRLGDVCPEMKVLAVRMVCSPNQKPTNVVKVSIPEDQEGKLQCKPGEIITNIDFASYGRQIVTSSGFSVDPMYNCNSETSMSNVQGRCLGRESCELKASNKFFGDPCFKVVKSLAIQARCSSTSGMSNRNMVFIINENSQQKLTCPNGRFGKVIWAGYGKQYRDATGFKVDPQFKCNSDKPHEIVEKRCKDKGECDIASDNQYYGDPCKNVLKTLAIEIECISY